MFKKTILGGLFLVCVGCSPKTPVDTNPSNLQVPAVGSEDWLFWVEKSVDTSDGQGHGPDYGSQEWCSVIEHKLFEGKSGEIPCSPSWNEKVTEKLKKVSN